jgi:hypothetical protein
MITLQSSGTLRPALIEFNVMPLLRQLHSGTRERSQARWPTETKRVWLPT